MSTLLNCLDYGRSSICVCSILQVCVCRTKWRVTN